MTGHAPSGGMITLEGDARPRLSRRRIGRPCRRRPAGIRREDESVTGGSKYGVTLIEAIEVQ